MAESPVFRLTDKDGAVYDVTAPDQTTAENELTRMKGGGQSAGSPAIAPDDFVKSAGTGLVRGLANIPGLPGDLKSIGDAGINWVTDKIFGDPTPEQAAIRERVQTLGLPTSQAIRDVASKVSEPIIGPLHEAQTTPGKFAETAGEFTSSALAGPARRIPDIIKQIFKYGTVPGIASEGASYAADKFLPGNAVAQAVARTAGGMTAAGGAAYLSRNQGMRPPAPGVDPAARMKQAEEFGVPLTEGQATGNISQQAFEESARHDARGPQATQTMQGFDVRQKAALDAAAAGPMRERFAGGFAPVEGADVAGEKIAAAIKQRIAQHEDEASRLYKSSEAKGTVVDQGAAANILQTVAQKLAAENHSFDRVLHPTAFRALKDIKELGDIGAASRTGVALDQIDTIRKRFRHYTGRDDQDARAVVLVKKAFDGWLDDAIDNKLFTGDPAGLAELKAARAQSSLGKRLSDTKQKDDAGKLIAKMAEDGRTGQEVGNWLFGKSIIEDNPTTVRVAQKIKGTFGQQSEEWSTIRQGAWTRIIQGATASEKGAQAVSSAINEFLNGKGKALSQVLYSPEEREQMRRFGQTAKWLVPNPKATNPSKSSYGMARLANFGLHSVGAMLGMAHGDLTSAILATSSGAAVDRITQGLERMGHASAAQRSVNPKLNAPIFDPRAMAAMTGRTGVEAVQPERRLIR